MDLVTALGILRRRWLILAICIAAGLGGGYELVHHETKRYAATAVVLVNVPNSGNLENQLIGTQLSTNLVTTYANLISTGSIQTQIATALRTNGFPLAGTTVAANTVASTFLIDIRATSPNPSTAQVAANTGALALVDAVAALQSGQTLPVKVKVVGNATYPTAPYSPRRSLELVLGGLLGLLIGMALIAAVEALDRSVRTVAQADALMHAPLLGIVPARKGKTLIVGAKREGAAGEPYRALRTAIRFLDLDRPVQTILFTSPSANDGKTATAANLAMALALSGERVILVDADLRRPGLGKALGLESAVGLTSLVLGNVAISDILQPYATNLRVIASGPLPPNPSEILGSQLINGVIHDLAGMCDMVIIDSPPVLPVADAVTLSVQVDATVVVLRHGSTLRNAVAATHRRLDAVGAHVVGYVLNAVPRREQRDYYLDYQYGYAAKHPTSTHDHSAA